MTKKMMSTQFILKHINYIIKSNVLKHYQILLLNIKLIQVYSNIFLIKNNYYRSLKYYKFL